MPVENDGDREADVSSSARTEEAHDHKGKPLQGQLNETERAAVIDQARVLEGKGQHLKVQIIDLAQHQEKVREALVLLEHALPLSAKDLVERSGFLTFHDKSLQPHQWKAELANMTAEIVRMAHNIPASFKMNEETS